jgi:predicted TIM-barrel fold metal-dependent hydrolase
VYTGPVIDTHMHLWDLANGYPWLSKPDPAFERLIGNYDQLRRDFLAPAYVALTRDANVVKSVHIQAFGFVDDPVAETTWLRAQTSRYGYPTGLVAYADLIDPRLDETLRRHCEGGDVRGVRMPLNYDTEPWRRMADREDYMRDTQWRKGFALLSRHGLVFDMQIYDHQAPDAVALARSFPDTTIVVEHLAWPIDLSESGFESWVRYVASLAECPNVFMKMSGIGCVFQRSRRALVLQYLRQAVATFGAARCMFGSNCPPDTLYYSFAELMETYSDAFSSLSASEQHDVFHGTAQRVYRL